MFRVGQIILPTKFIKNLSRVANHLANCPQALLLTQGSAKHQVVMNGELFNEIMKRATAGKVDLPVETRLKRRIESDVLSILESSLVLLEPQTL